MWSRRPLCFSLAEQLYAAYVKAFIFFLFSSQTIISYWSNKIIGILGAWKIHDKRKGLKGQSRIGHGKVEEIQQQAAYCNAFNVMRIAELKRIYSQFF